jgi:hypothetical protein
MWKSISTGTPAKSINRASNPHASHSAALAPPASETSFFRAAIGNRSRSIDMEFYMNTSPKVVFVTGASQGIGAEFAKTLRKLDYRVVATARSIEP